MEENKILYKILLLGEDFIGKTCWLIHYTDGIFPKNCLSTIGVDFKIKFLKFKDKNTVKLQIWDTPGQERFYGITRNYYKYSNAIILIYDITNKASFDKLKFFIEDVKKGQGDNFIKIPIFLVGNKMDAEERRVITKEQGEKFAKEHGCLFSESSAKTGENIDYIFDKLVLTLLENEQNPKFKNPIKELEDKVRKKINENNFNILKKYISF